MQQEMHKTNGRTTQKSTGKFQIEAKIQNNMTFQSIFFGDFKKNPIHHKVT